MTAVAHIKPSAFRPCIVIPTYDNPMTIERVVRAVREHCSDVIVVDDGSGPAAQERIAEIERAGLAHVYRRAQNGGKGAAVKDGLRRAAELGFTHALQVDADGQHELGDIPRFLQAAERAPDHMVLGQPSFDASVPRARLYGRQISIFWAAIETFGDRVGDPLCGFRVYPVKEALAANARGDRMDFDPEIVVRMAWRGVPVTKLKTKVRYIAAEDGGVSHFQAFWDNARISSVHTRLVCEALVRGLLSLLGARRLMTLAPSGRGG